MAAKNAKAPTARFIPAQGNALGTDAKGGCGLKASFISSPHSSGFIDPGSVVVSVGFAAYTRVSSFEFNQVHAMPQSLSHILIHVIFSTKDRTPFLSPPVRGPLHAYLATIARDMDCECYRAGGVADHVHLAIRLSRTTTTAKLVEKLKTVSSKWVKAQFPDLATFAWQSGYGAFSVGPTKLGALIQYIDDQEEHHMRISFQEEYRKLLKKYGVEYDERYVWD